MNIAAFGMFVLLAAGVAGAAHAEESVGTAACTTELKSPRIAATSPAALPAVVWDHQGSWESEVTFRIDESGVPYMIRVQQRGVDDEANAFEQATSDALRRYRFCLPANFSTRTGWRASMQFTRAKVDEAYGGVMFVQQFIPFYSRKDMDDDREGTVKVQGTFGPDGRAIDVAVLETSGDKVLEAKTLVSMATNQLILRDGVVLQKPLVFVQPYTYRIRR